VPPTKLPHFTPAAPIVLKPTAPIPTPIPKQMIVSLAWMEDPLRYRVAMTPPGGVPLATLITPEVEPVFLHVSLFLLFYMIIWKIVDLHNGELLMLNCKKKRIPE
jgi:hypothetical protein